MSDQNLLNINYPPEIAIPEVGEVKLPDNIFEGFSDAEKEAVVAIMREYAESGRSEILDDLKYADFEEIPVDVKTFIHDPRYLGKGLTDNEGRFTVFPY